jgi:predicted esterase
MRTILGLAVALTWSGAAGADDAPGFAGDWKSTFGAVHLEQDGDAVTGRFGAGKFPIKGTVKGPELKFEYDEGQAKGDATFTLDPSGHSYTGTFQVRGGRRGVWNGWRPNPKASEGEPADFAGLWLTDLGLMELKQERMKVRGRYALRGTSSLEGDVKGRHLEFRYKGFRPGPGWFDLDAKGTALAGASGTDGFPGWSGWKGRKAPEFARHAPLIAGKVVDGSTEGLLSYTVRAPEGYKPGDGRKWPCVVILHGSNMNGTAYVNTLAAAWPEVARDYIILGINGETPSRITDDPAFNYTYVNYVGRSTFKGFPGTDRESPALVAEALADLTKAYPIRHYFVGGHSQGGFLAYSLLMNSPELIRGAFPISAGAIFQCEPSAYTDEKLKAAQRAVPLAIVHGKTDPMVPFAMGEYAHGLFLDAGWPALRLFADDTAAHMFARLPVGPAIRWLEVMTSDDPKALLDFAERRWKESGRHDAVAASLRLKSMKLDPDATARLERLSKAIDAEVAPKAKGYLESIRAAKDNVWVDGFLAFRDDYALAPAASEAMAAFDALRAKHDEPARKLIGEARGLFQQGRRDEGYAKAREVVEKYYASSSYRLAKGWLAEWE